MNTVLSGRSLNNIQQEGDRDPSMYLLVQAYCRIVPGDLCTVDFPYHSDVDSYSFHNCCHQQTAEITAIHGKGSVSIKMTSGRAIGRIYEKIRTEILIFPGPYTKE